MRTRPQLPGAASTTHSEWGSGRPRLLITADDTHVLQEITADVTRIGSSEECDIRLPGISPVHAIIRHDGHDDYDLEMLGPGETSANIRKSAAEEGRTVEVLHTGARFTAGGWRFVFVRDEFADHGRPYGGRLGGEGAHQQMQPPRPDYEQEGHHGSEIAGADPEHVPSRGEDIPVD
ncbi:FHA domain-containing protein [Microbacterium capsulatum]|uniref:FHA domain-containing protein n=1 Tax=Microbacterium capsulatum TaxID=3041921 RepID=A0ABU0XFC3_9MICO|nr:FHA domain-containing protein [Microbacterium sp. ASV81]MDQ4213818.1 FHA domain-containing protein [Microbacterium sp. ASV81]